MNTVIDIISLFARAGGGGSSSSGDGGGGSGIAVLGYLLVFYPVKLFQRKLSRDKAMVVTIAITVILSLLVLVIAALGGSSIGWWIAIEFIIGMWVGWSAQMFGVWERMIKHFKKADEDLAKAGWNEAELQQAATQAFMRYQQDWSNRDSSHFSEYLTPYYARHASLMIMELVELKRFNVIKDPKIIRIDTSAVYDNADNNQDFFSVLIEASADDYLMNETGETLYNDKSPFIEEWTFQRSGNSWLLANIRQSTESQSASEQDMRQFAADNSLYYSLDMGWLFLPTRGELFNNGKRMFGYSDINNHVIGTYKERLVQLYTYQRRTGSDKSDFTNYLVGQISVPKSYGGILVERNKGLINRIFAPKGYQKYEFEWPDFNKRYSVYATDQSRLATFELINPGFMAFLHDNFNDINIEVVDNIIYFYAEKPSARSDYQQLMELLLKAFKELQL